MGFDTLDARIRALERENERLREDLRQREGVTPRSLLSTRETLLVEAERAAHLGSWTWDLRTDEVEWSDEFYRILGLTPGCVAPSARRFFDAVHPDDRERIQAAADESVSTGSRATNDFRFVWPTGEIRHVRLHAFPILDAYGKPVQMVGTVIDLTDMRGVQDRLFGMIDELRHAQRMARMGSWVWLAETDGLEWSEGFYRLLGLRGDEPASEELFDRHVHADDLEVVQRVRREFGERTSNPLEFRILQPSGTQLTVRSEVQPVHDAAGTRIGFRGVVQDITRARELEDQVRRVQKLDAVGRLAGGIAHDFNNYLLVIGAHVDLLEGLGDLSGEARESLRSIGQACDRCSVLTRQLLTFSRKRSSNPETLDLVHMVERITPMLHSVLGESNVLRVIFATAPVHVHVDPGLLEQALINLVVNARDAMPDGGTVTIDLDVVFSQSVGESEGTRSRPGAYARLRVSDTGEGIPPEYIPRIFEPFFTTKDVGRGTGLGLATAYGVVSECGGTIELESEVGRGSTFVLYLPHVSCVDRVAEAASNDAPTAELAGRILLVEDVAAVRKVLRRQLERAGFEVTTASHGQQALEVLARLGGRVDLVLSDVVMPELGGVELEARLRERYPAVRCLLMTGYAEDGLGVSGARAPVLRKPFSARELVDRVGELCVLAERPARGTREQRELSSR